MSEYPESLFPEITSPQKKAFLASYAHNGRITKSGIAAQVNWRNHYNWLRDDPIYVQAFEVAKSMAGDFLEDEALRRAVEGIQKPIFYKGEHVDNVTEYSDLLLIVALKGAKPEKYRENARLQVEGDITVTVADRTRLANERLSRLRLAERDTQSA